MNILIAESDSKTITDLKTILGNLGHNVLDVVSTGEEAIEKARDSNPGLILIDLKLNGEMGGVDAADKIKNLQNIPIIFLTVFIKNCLNKSLGVSGDAIVLSKPVKQEHMEYGISRALSDRRSLK
jgi:CheY-like chemotaxis protein